MVDGGENFVMCVYKQHLFQLGPLGATSKKMKGSRTTNQNIKKTLTKDNPILIFDTRSLISHLAQQDFTFTYRLPSLIHEDLKRIFNFFNTEACNDSFCSHKKIRYAEAHGGRPKLEPRKP